MSHSRKFCFMQVMAAASLIAVLALSKTVAAETWSVVDQSDWVKDSAICASGLEQHPEIERLRGEIAEAESLDQAKALALTPTNAALGALRNARAIMPFSEDLRLAETRLADAHSRIESANTPRQVADEFSGMTVAILDERAAQLKVGKVGCDYTTGEVIAIVLGLILGIIPGLILLILLC